MNNLPQHLADAVKKEALKIYPVKPVLDFNVHSRPAFEAGASFLHSIQPSCRWVKASERLGEFKDSDFPEWKFFNVDFCKVDGKAVTRSYFRKDISISRITFGYTYIADFTADLPESEFHRIEYLEELPSPPKETAGSRHGESHNETCKHNFVGYCQCCYCGAYEAADGVTIIEKRPQATVEELSTKFSDWYFEVKETNGDYAPLAMQVFFWFEEHLDLHHLICKKKFGEEPQPSLTEQPVVEETIYFQQFDLIKGLTIGGCVPATLHYYEDKEVCLKPKAAPQPPVSDAVAFADWKDIYMNDPPIGELASNQELYNLFLQTRKQSLTPLK